MSEYNAERRTKRRAHQRAVMQGRERFEAEPVDLALDSRVPDQSTDSGDVSEDVGIEDVDADGAFAGAPHDHEDDHLLNELPPHWGVFNQHD